MIKLSKLFRRFRGKDDGTAELTGIRIMKISTAEEQKAVITPSVGLPFTTTTILVDPMFPYVRFTALQIPEHMIVFADLYKDQ